MRSRFRSTCLAASVAALFGPALAGVALSVAGDLLAQAGGSRMERHGDKGRLYTENPDRVVKNLGALAERENLTILSIATSSPTLEEAFVRLTEGA